MRALWIIAAGSLACSPSVPPLPTERHLPKGGAGSSLSATTDSGSADTASADAAVPLATPAELGAVVDELLGARLPNAADFLALFRSLTLAGDVSCPGDDLAFTTPASSCTSSTGYEYFGYAPYVDTIESADPRDTSDGTVHRVEIAQASFVITTPEGHTFEAGGGFIHTQELDTPERAWSEVFEGTFRWSAEGAPWLEAGTQVGWHIEGGRPDTGHYLSLAGPIAVGTSWLYIDHLHWNEATCDGVPDTALRIRDTEGRWYSWESGADCSTCGPVAFLDPSGTPEPIGELCIDLSGALAELDTRDDLPEGA